MIAPLDAIEKAIRRPPHPPANLHTLLRARRYGENAESLAGAKGYASEQVTETARRTPHPLNTVLPVSLERSRTTSDQGLSKAEIERIRAVLERWCRRNDYVVFWTLGDALRTMPEAEAREFIRRALNTLRTAQTRADLEPEYMVVLEVTGGLHAHIVGIATPKIMKAIRRSEKFAPFMLRPSRAIRPVTNAYGFAYLADEYLVKETGDPKFALPPGGGDRSWLSPTLKAVMVAEGRIEDYQRTTSGNLKPTPPRAARPVQAIKAEIKPTQSATTTNVVQLALFDDLPQARADEGLPAMIREVREQKGISQTAFAEDYLDIRQPHLANVERLHDRLSPARRRAARYHLERLAA